MELAELKALTDKIQSDWAAYQAAMKLEQDQIKVRGEAFGELKEKLAKIDKALTDASEAKDSALRVAAALKSAGAGSDPSTEDGMPEYKAAFDKYCRTRQGEEKRKELSAKVKSMSSLSGPEGGFWVPFERDPEFMRNFVETSAMRQVARVQTVGAASLKGSRRVSRGATGGWVGEVEARTVTTTPTIGQWEIPVRELYAYPDAPADFLEDAEVNIESWLAEEIGAEYSFIENTAFLRGVGNKQPRGLLTYGVTDPGNGEFIESQDIATSVVLAANDFIDLQGKLLEPYQANASWAFTRATLTAIRKLIVNSTTASYLWQPGLTQDAPAMLLGRPYTVMADMYAIATGTNPIVAYGDFKQCYRIVDRRGIRVIRDELTNKPLVGFYSTKRVGGDVVRHEAMKLLRNKS